MYVCMYVCMYVYIGGVVVAFCKEIWGTVTGKLPYYRNSMFEDPKRSQDFQNTRKHSWKVK